MASQSSPLTVRPSTRISEAMIANAMRSSGPSRKSLIGQIRFRQNRENSSMIALGSPTKKGMTCIDSCARFEKNANPFKPSTTASRKHRHVLRPGCLLKICSSLMSSWASESFELIATVPQTASLTPFMDWRIHANKHPERRGATNWLGSSGEDEFPIEAHGQAKCSEAQQALPQNRRSVLKTDPSS